MYFFFYTERGVSYFYFLYNCLQFKYQELLTLHCNYYIVGKNYMTVWRICIYYSSGQNIIEGMKKITKKRRVV